MKPPLSIAAVGDIAFAGRNVEAPCHPVFSEILSVLHGFHLVVGNLESPLTDAGGAVRGKCTLRGAPAWAGILREAGFHLLCLANNHIMDFGEEGLRQTISYLRAAGLHPVGAGENEEEACRPVFLEVAGRCIGVLARTGVEVSSPCYAGKSRAGVALLDEGETIQAIRSCGGRADLIFLFCHWGMEKYAYPSPQQRRLARRLVEEGADAILGHHPHVLQGVEKRGKAVVAYSLGNFLFDEFEWKWKEEEPRSRLLFSPLSKEERKGLILGLTWEDQDVKVSPFFTRIQEEAKVIPDDNPRRREEYEKFSAGITRPLYAPWWTTYALWNEWKLRMRPRFSGKDLWRTMMKARPRHVKEFASRLRKTMQIAAGKSTNPYE